MIPLEKIMRRFEKKLERRKLIAFTPIEGANAGRLKLDEGKDGELKVSFNAPGEFGVTIDFHLALLGKEPKAYVDRTVAFLAKSMGEARAERKIIVPTAGLVV